MSDLAHVVDIVAAYDRPEAPEGTPAWCSAVMRWVGDLEAGEEAFVAAACREIPPGVVLGRAQRVSSPAEHGRRFLLFGPEAYAGGDPYEAGAWVVERLGRDEDRSAGRWYLLLGRREYVGSLREVLPLLVEWAIAERWPPACAACGAPGVEGALFRWFGRPVCEGCVEDDKNAMHGRGLPFYEGEPPAWDEDRREEDRAARRAEDARQREARAVVLALWPDWTFGGDPTLPVVEEFRRHKALQVLAALDRARAGVLACRTCGGESYLRGATCPTCGGA